MFHVWLTYTECSWRIYLMYRDVPSKLARCTNGNIPSVESVSIQQVEPRSSTVILKIHSIDCRGVARRKTGSTHSTCSRLAIRNIYNSLVALFVCCFFFFSLLFFNHDLTVSLVTAEGLASLPWLAIPLSSCVLFFFLLLLIHTCWCWWINSTHYGLVPMWHCKEKQILVNTGASTGYFLLAPSHYLNQY